MRQRRAATAFVPLALALGGTLPARAHAQLAPGTGEDAYVLPSRVLRVTFAPAFEYADERFRRDGTREPYGAGVSGHWDGTRLLALYQGQQALRSLTGNASATLSFGDIRITADRRSTVLPLALDYGLFGRIQLGVMVPFVRTAANVVANANGARTAAAGLNPALYGGTNAPTALSRNTAIVTELLNAAQSREQANGCTTRSTSQPCTLAAQARQAALAIATLYGTETTRGSAAVPLAGSADAAAIDARLQSLRASLGLTSTTLPAHAALPIGRDDLTTFVTDAEAGLGLDDFGLVERSHFGDVEGSIKVLLLDGIGPLGDAPRRAVGVRLAVAGIVRAPTGQGEQPGNPLDVGTGDGQTDVELRGALDVTLGAHVWISAAARRVQQRADAQWVRIPGSASEEGLTPAAFTYKAQRDLGDATQFEVTPRWQPNRYLGFAATYQVRKKDADRYQVPLLDAADLLLPLQVSALGANTAFTEQRAGIGVTWSTLAAARRGQRVIPLDISLQHLETVRATGGIVPRLTTDVLSLRLWWGTTRGARR